MGQKSFVFHQLPTPAYEPKAEQVEKDINPIALFLFKHNSWASLGKSAVLKTIETILQSKLSLSTLMK